MDVILIMVLNRQQAGRFSIILRRCCSRVITLLSSASQLLPGCDQIQELLHHLVMASPNANLRTPLRETPESERDRRAQTKVTGEDSTPSKRGANGFNQHEFSGEDKENAGLYPIAKPMTPPDDNIDSAAIDQSSSSHKHATASTDNNNAVDGVVSNFQKNLAAAQKEMDDSRTVTREDIREQQQKEVRADDFPLHLHG